MKYSPSSVYDQPAVREQIARQRLELESRGITPYRFIGAAYTPGIEPRTPADQEWVQGVILR